MFGKSCFNHDKDNEMQVLIKIEKKKKCMMNIKMQTFLALQLLPVF